MLYPQPGLAGPARLDSPKSRANVNVIILVHPSYNTLRYLYLPYPDTHTRTSTGMKVSQVR